MPTLITIIALAAIWFTRGGLVASWIWWVTVALLVLHWWCAATVRTAFRDALRKNTELGDEPIFAKLHAEQDEVVNFWVRISLAVAVTLGVLSLGLLGWRFFAL